MGFKTILILTIIFTAAKAEYKSYQNFKVYKIVPTTDKEVQILSDLKKDGNYAFWSDVIREKSDVRIMVDPEKQNEFQEYLRIVNIEAKVALDDVQRVIDAQLTRPVISRINNEYDWSYYQQLDEINEWLNKTAEAFPDVVTLVTIGRSEEGRYIRGVKIDYKKQENPTIGMIEGGIHAREWISPATVTWIIKEFLTSTDADVRFLAENIVWHMFPVVNPDGYAYTFTDNRMWRKNRNPHHFVPGGCGQNDDMSRGIDLNRNFGFLWMSTGASSNPCAETFAGPAPNSEHEATAIINHVYRLQQEGHLVYYLTFHSFAQMVLVPYSHVSGAEVLDAPNYADMYEIAIRGMDKLKKRNGTEYLVGTSADILYEVSGSSFDWVKGVANVPIVYLFELRDDGVYGFLLPPELIIDNNNEIMDGLIEMDKVARQIGYYHANADALKLSTILFATLISMMIFM